MKLATQGAVDTMAEMEDDFTKATEISCEDEIITYKYLLKDSEELKWETVEGDAKAEITNGMRDVLVEDLCADAGTRSLLKVSGGLVMNYYLSNGSLFTSIKTTAQSCKK